MKVKIIKATLPTYWYANRIGEVFEVTNIVNGFGDFEVTKGEMVSGSFINSNDVVPFKKQDFLYCIKHERMELVQNSMVGIGHEDVRSIDDFPFFDYDFCEFPDGWAVTPPPDNFDGDFEGWLETVEEQK